MKHSPTEHLYTESTDISNPHRAAMLAQVAGLIAREQKAAKARRTDFFRPDTSSLPAYKRSVAGYRRHLARMLGWPLTLPRAAARPRVRSEFVAHDDLGTIHRLWIRTLPGLDTYGLLFLPPGKGPHPLVISQHGGAGTPELCSGFVDSSNYNDMTRRVLRRGFAVFAPQLLLWNQENAGAKYDKDRIDRQLKQLGGSLAALELYRLRRSLDYLTARPDIDGRRVGMIGLSYGGFYTLFAAALDPRIKAAVSSCFVSNRFVYDFPDWTWFDAGNRLLDAEVAGLVCPRPLYVEVGTKDELFSVQHARPELARIGRLYRKLGVGSQFRSRVHGGGHELDKDPGVIDFLCRHLA